jgi:hypothetical protein
MEKKVNMTVVSETTTKKKRTFKIHQGITEQQHV